MQHADDDSDNNRAPSSNGQIDHDITLAKSSNFGIDYWRNRLATAAPTVFPLRQSSHPVLDGFITRCFLVPSQRAVQDHGITLKAFITLAYGLVLRAHADAPNEVVFAYIDDTNRTNASTSDHCPMAGFIQNTAFDWNQTTLRSLIDLQGDIAQLQSQQFLKAGQLAIPAEIACLFRTVLVFHSSSTLETNPSVQTPKALGIDYDLEFNVKIIDWTEITVDVRFASKSVSTPEIEVFLDHFGLAVENISLKLTNPLSDVDLISTREQQRLIVDINPPYPHESLSHANNVSQLIEEQVFKTPQKIALQLTQDQFVTYQQLDSLANNVGHTLISHGSKHGDLVGIYMDKSCEMFISILGIHKAGCSYVPLDPLHPSERIQTILRIANIGVVLTSEEYISHLQVQNYDGIRLLPINIDHLFPAVKPDVHVSREDVSHVLFTSGSTGVPKGVILTHGTIIESVLGSREVFGPLDGRTLQFANYTFDVSVWDWCGTLSAGGTLCVVPRQKLMDNLGGVASSMDVTFLETTPTVMALISPEEVPTLQILGPGGEPLTPEVRNKWADAVNVINVYGPTEAGTNVTALKRVTLFTELSNIGRPFGLNAIYVLNERLQPVPLGCVGELFIGGPQLARGYLGAPEQTAKAFVSDPFRPGSIMYASGDLVRMSPIDYSITYLGRRDTQIKIRGLRIEIGEIEAVLKDATRDISNAAVIKVDTGSETLVAFLEYSSNAGTDDIFIVHEDHQAIATLIASLNGAARQRLAPYMVPAIYVPLNRFPLASSGKLDRKTLNAFFYAHQDEIRDLRLESEQFSSVEAPRDELQATLRSLWASILGVTEDLLSIDADFFAVGGDSISAIRLASAARDAGINLHTTDIIQNSTIIAMSQVVRSGVVDHKFDDDEVPSVALDEMKPEDLTLLDIDQSGLDKLRKELLSKHGLSPSDVLDIYPCTALQTSFLVAGFFLNDAYVIRQIYDLPRGSNSNRIRKAFDHLINHPNGTIFRTTFVLDDTTGRYLQVVTRPLSKSMEWNTIEVTSEAALDESIRDYQFGRGCQSFKPGELMTRACVFEVNGVPRALVWSLHHAVADHWSINNAECDIADMYLKRALPHRRSFKPMIKYLSDLDRTAGLRFWHDHLLDANPTPFPQSVPDGSRAIANTVASRDVHTDHASFTHKFGVTAASLATAAWSIVLAAHTSSSDVVFGQVVAGRNAPIKDIDIMAGNTINTVAHRVILNPEATIINTLLAIQQDQTEISKYEHIDLAELRLQGTPAASLFKTLLNFTNLPGDQRNFLEALNLEADSYLWVRRSGSYDGQDVPLTITVIPVTTDDFYIEANYSDKFLSKAEVSVILDHFESTLRFMMNHPERLVSDVELINEQEMQLLVPPEKSTTLEPNGHDPHDYARSLVQTVSGLIDLQVQRTPQRIALQFCQDVFMTYQQMNLLSNNLAWKLIRSGVERGTLVALYMDKSIEMFLSILAVHKAGGGYVPLDPEHPSERINTILRLSKAAIVLTSKDLQQQLGPMLVEAEATLMVVEFTGLSADANPNVQLTRNDISHVLFTSGSTGVPKGVVLTHGSILESALGSVNVVGRLDGRILQFSNYTFDLSVWDWACTLSGGGTLCITPKQKLIDDLGGVAQSLDVTFLQTTPTVALLISPEKVPSLQTLLLGGEVLTPEVRNAWADVLTLINGYGPTEASTYVAAMKRVTSSTGLSNIGRPFGLNVTYVLDERFRPVPLGCVGELFIGGPQVARGYLGAPEQTAKVFIDDPFRPGSMMYASGDLVRMSPVDHDITYLGRRDTQIKMRGLRIEIGEIEVVLKEASTIVVNAVVIKVDTGKESLVAFVEVPSSTETDDLVVVREDPDFDVSLVTSLRHAARQRLPPYMVPSTYVPINRFPLSSSGKLDRKALGAFFYAHEEEIKGLSLDSDQLSSIEVPHDELQATLRSLWASTLNLKEDLLGIDDDFFIVGGDSISAIRLASAARDAGLSLPVIDIIRNPTVRKMAQVVRSAIINNDYDDDETPTVTLDKMRPEDLTLLTLNEDGLNSLRDDLLPKHGLSASDVLDVYPSTAPQTSFLLAGMIVHDAYIVTISWDLPPNTSVVRIQEAFDTFFNQHNGMMLRTVFVLHPVSNRWLQVVIKPERKRMEWNIITVADERELSSRVLEYEQNRGSQQFKDGELLTRVCVFQLDGHARVLVWTLHHALVDHWTLEHMVFDIDSVYANYPLPSRRSFKPMVKYLQRVDHVGGVEFWRRHLHDASPTLFLQGRSNARRVTANAIIYRHIRMIDPSLLISRFGIMPSTLITCAWSIVLSAHANTTDVVFGQVLSGRTAPIKDIGVMTGIMINTVARRVCLNHAATVLETLQQIQSEQLEISKHENISLAELQAEGIPVSTLFNTILNFRNKGFNKVIERDGRLAEDSLFANPRTEGRDRLDYPFALDIDISSTGGIFIRAQHAPECIFEAEVNTFLDHFESALHFLINHPQSSIADVELVNERERQLLVPREELTELEFNAYNQNSCYYHDHTVQTVASLIELQVEKTPQRIALQFGGDVFLTYREMNHLSNSLAWRLLRIGIEGGKLVALYMDKSIEMFLSILAIHKAGCGYVPLDPEHPTERINTILQLSSAAIVLTTRELQQQLVSVLVEGKTSFMVVDHTELSADVKPNVHVTRDDISHVLFTSGSTGVPKGVILRHGSILASTLGSMNVINRLTGRVLQFSNYTFDLSVWDWACTLTGGGTLCVVPKQKLINDLGSVARSLDITFMQTTPTVAALISPEDVPSLQMLLLGGEVLTYEIRNAWADTVNLLNGYGPTEASTYVAVMKRVTSTTGLSDIGRPFGLNVTYILDERLRPVPLGCIGELFIGGPQVAGGYLGAPEQTAKVFINDPFRSGSKMYASGDLVRMSPVNHTITYLGRRDTQVKIRGLRIETEEIEAVLKEANSSVANAAVIKVDAGSESLVAFLEYPSTPGTDDIIIAHDDHQIIGALISSLRRAVLQKMPPYMAPSIYIPLNRFPLSSSGKLDRKALAAFFYAHHERIRDLQLDSEQVSSLEAPHNELQATLRSLWASILNLKEYLLGIDDDFFMVGGDSISAIRLASAARDAGLSLPVTDIIRNPTIRQMAQIVQSAAPNNDYDDDETPAVTLDNMAPKDLTLLSLDSAALDSLRNDLLPKYGLSASDVLDVYPSTALQTSFLLTGMIIHDAYIVTMSWDLPPGTDTLRLQDALDNFVNQPNGMMLRTVFLFQLVSNEWFQTLIRPGKKRMECQVITVADEKELESRISEYEQGRGSQRFADGELLTRACIFQIDGCARALVWTLHHALMDRWSMENVTSDIERIYATNPLPLRRSFKPMIKYLQRIDRIGGIEFWRKHLHNALPTSFLKGRSNARRVTANTIINRDLHSVDISSLTRRFGIMPSTLVTCAWALVLSAHSNSADVVFGQVLSGRNAPIKNIESMTGCMINTIARRVLLNPKITVLEMLQQLQFEQFEISKHESISLAELQTAGIPVTSLFNTILNLWNKNFDTSSENDTPFVGDQLFATPRKDGRGRLDYPLVVDVELGSTDFVFISSVHASEVISDAETHVLLDHFESALRFMIEHPEELIADVELINDRERRILVPSESAGLESNAYSECLSYPYDLSFLSVQNVSQLIELQVEKTPQRIALQYGQDMFVTYRQMDLLSNNLAWKLVESGVKRGNLVAIYMDKSIEMILSILAIHKAGGGYVPLDPEYPADRINTVIGLAKASIVLTTQDLQQQLAGILGVGAGLLIVNFRELIVDTKPDVEVTRDDICHVLFTSGSTGIPKGVILTHGSIMESALRSRELVGPFDGRVLQCVNYTFDVSVWDWSCTLTGGGTLCIVPKQKLLNDFAAVTSSFDITLLEVTPTVAGLLSPEEVPTLAIMILGGEMLSLEVRNKWGDAVILMNAYGATETSTNNTIMRKVTPSTDVSNIGRPFGHNFIYVLDGNRRPVPLGCIGELYIGGPQVARGYLGAPEQTEKVFVNDPFLPGSVMYASGDLARISPIDYSLTYLGRRDTQIKIRGLRVEIGEIEAVLKSASTDISNAAVVKVEASSESLVAFLEYSPGPDTTDEVFIVQENEQFIGTLVATLRRAAQQRLAPYMVPTVYIPLNRFPLSSSGKLDRKALTAFFYANLEEIRDLRLDSELFATLSSMEMPQDELQATLRTLWASILNLKENLLSIDDDFFLVGGDSISAIRLASAARHAGLSLPVTDIIRNPTIRRMAQIVQSVNPDNDYDHDETPTVTLDKMSPEDLTLLDLNEDELEFLRTDLLPKSGLLASDVLDVYPATPTQASHLLAGMTVNDAYIVPLAYDLPPKTDITKVQETFDNFIAQPNGMMLRTVFVFHPVLKRWLQVLVRPGGKRMEWQIITAADETELDLRVSEYELSRGSERFADGQLLCRGCIFQIDGYARVLVWTVHHALMDRWSTENTTSDLERVYADYPVPLRRSFKPMVKYLQRDDRTTDIDFWKKHLHNALPTSFLQDRSSATDAIMFRDIHVDHISLVRRFGIMPSTLITCAWSVVLSLQCKSTDVVFGHILSGRNAPIKDIGTMCGIMINTVARRVSLSPKVTVLETLQQIQSDQLEISKHENVSLAELEDDGVPVSTLFHSLLNFRNKGFNQVIEHDGCLIEDRLLANLRKAARGTIEYPLCLDVDLRPTGVISIGSFHASEIIPKAEMQIYLDQFESALQFIIDYPEKSTLELISYGTMRQLEANGHAQVDLNLQ